MSVFRERSSAPREANVVVPRRRGREQAFRIGACAALLTLVACSIYVDTDRDQCTRDEECRGRAGLSANAVCSNRTCTEPQPALDSGAVDAPPEDPVWGCLGKVPPYPESDPTAPVSFQLGFIDVVSRRELAGLGVKACASTDRDCAAPLVGSEAQTGADGIANVAVHSGFRGFLRIDTSQAGDLVPSLLYVQPVPDKARPEGYPTEVWGLVSKSSVVFIASSAGKEVKPGLGHIFFHASDCSGKPAAGVVVSVSPITASTFVYYLDSGGSPGLTQQSTAALGIGGYLNLASGTVTLTYRREDGVFIGSEEVIVRGDEITYVRPLPLPL